MAPTDVAVRPRRSAFAAAFLSFVFPGLGHAYLGRWLRAILWAALPILGIAALAGLAMSQDIRELATLLADPDVLTGILVFLVIDAFYRLFALLDAYRLATDTSVGTVGSRLLSSAGLAALIVVLMGSHVVLAQPVLYATDTYADIVDNAGDDSEILTPEELAALGEEFELITEELEEIATPDPDGLRRGDDPTDEPTTAPETPEPTAEPSSTPAEGPKWTGKGRLNILLIGHDGGRQGRAANSMLTDTMITISVDPVTGRVAFISLPRDATGIPLPRNWAAYNALGGKFNGKVNTLYAQARANSALFPGNDRERGYNALMGALGELYGLDIDYYVAVNLNTFRSVVNTLGGVIVDVQLPVWDTGYSSADGRGKVKLYVPPGMARMNGQQALAYARSRHGSSDFDRAARQQRVITSARDQTDIGDLLQPGVISELIGQLKKDVKTNIPPKLVPAMLGLAAKVNLDRRENLVLSSSRFGETCYPCGPSGLWMIKMKPAAIKSAVANVFNDTRKQARAINKIRDEGAVVHILNGQGGSNTKAINIAANLRSRGMDAVVPPVNGGLADVDDAKKTVITVYNGVAEGIPETIIRLKRTLKGEVVYAEDPEQDADVVVIVGKKTPALKKP